MSTYVESLLNKDESVIRATRIHGSALVLPGILLFICVAFAVTVLIAAMQSVDSKVAMGGLCAAALTFFPSAIYFVDQLFSVRTSEFAITNRRLIVKYGFLSRRTIETPLSRLESVQLQQNILQRIWNAACLDVAGTGGTRSKTPAISDGQRFVQDLQRSIQEREAAQAPAAVHAPAEPALV